MTLWKTDPKKYAAIYFDGRDELRTTNPAMEYGKRFAEAMEFERETGDLLTDAAILLVSQYDIKDQEMVAEMRTKDGWVKLLGRPDRLDSVTKSFIEIKTGMNAWTQAKADKHPQLKFYATIIYLIHKVVPPSVKLIWIETERTQSDIHGVEIKPTGRIETFEVQITLKDILATMAEVSRIAKEIEIAYVSHVPDERLKW